MRKRYTRTDIDKRMRPDERHFARPHLVAIAQEAFVSVKRNMQQTRSPPRDRTHTTGPPHGRSRSSQPQPGEKKETRFQGDPLAACLIHKHLTNDQANWIYGRGYCACCGQRMSSHATEVEGHFSACPFKHSPKDLTIIHPDMPKGSKGRHRH